MQIFFFNYVLSNRDTKKDLQGHVLKPYRYPSQDCVAMHNAKKVINFEVDIGVAGLISSGKPWLLELAP